MNDMAFGLFKKKKKETSDARYMTLVIKEVVPIAKEAVNLVFEKPTTAFDYQPGQFITIIAEVNGQKIRRAYSLCSTPFLDEHPAVTVKRVPDGKMSNHVNETYKAGQSVKIMEPMGMFTTEYDASVGRKVVMIGGGSGITPLISLIRSILYKEPKSEVALIYGNRSEEYIVFKELLIELQSAHEGRFKLIHILENDPNGFATIKGRPSPGIINDLISSNDLLGAEYFLCGPQPMMDATVEGLKLAGIGTESIRMESFEAGKTSPEHDEAPTSNSASEVTILLEGEEFVVPVKMNQAILEIGLAQGLDMPYSCQSGLCTACRGKCLEGDISIEDAEGLSQDELDEGYRLLCVGKPLTPTVKVEIG
jgi:ring-1,2-phenylacetyl-CoA epoxidase subunit PaaE